MRYRDRAGRPITAAGTAALLSMNPNLQGYDGAVMSFVEYLYELGK